MDKKVENKVYCIYGEATDCAASEEYICKCLVDTQFKSGICPFYVTKRESERGYAKSVARLIGLDRLDLICKYRSHKYLDRVNV